MLTKQKPFNQFKEAPPKGMGGRWFRRHVVINHMHREILIQVMWDGSGELKTQEYHEIIKGEWWRHVPKERIDEYRHAIGSGYAVKAIVLSGMDDGEEHVCIQLLDMRNGHLIIKDSSFQPLPEGGH